jgi:multiple sugar transport system substrate-binding protein
LLAAVGHPDPPETWNELLDLSQRIIEKKEDEDGLYGFLWQGAQYEGLVCTFLEFISSNGGAIYVDGSFRLNTDENVKALQFMVDLIHEYRVSPPSTFTEMKEEEVRRAFQRGDAVFERNWPYAWKLHQAEDSPVQGKVGIAALPHFPGSTSASTLGGWHVGISQFSDVKEQAWKLLRFLTSSDAQRKLALNLGWNPGRSDVYRDEEVLLELPHLERLRDVFTHAVARPNLPYYTQVSAVIQRNVNKCLAGNIDPGQALEQTQREIEEMTRIYEE